MIPTLSQVCSLESPFDADIRDYAAGQCRTVEVWLGKLESYLESCSLDDVKLLLQENGVRCGAASYQGGLFFAEKARRDEAWNLFARRLTLCQDLEIPTLVVAGDLLDLPGRDGLHQLMDLLLRAATFAEGHSVRLAFEFRAASAYLNNLQTAAAVIGEVGHSNLGICLDAFQFYTGPSKLSDLALLHPGNLFHLQLCDLADVPRELATDAHRIMPGEGDVPVRAMVATALEMGYQGCVSIELMNPQIWQVPALQFGEVATAALRHLLGQAASS